MTWGWCRSCHGNPIAGECKGIGTRHVGWAFVTDGVCESRATQYPTETSSQEREFTGKIAIYKVL